MGYTIFEAFLIKILRNQRVIHALKECYRKLLLTGLLERKASAKKRIEIIFFNLIIGIKTLALIKAMTIQPMHMLIQCHWI